MPDKANTADLGATLTRLLRFMVEKGASDLYLTANAPITLRLHGNCVPIQAHHLSGDDIAALLHRLLPTEQAKKLELQTELSVGVRQEDIGRFRVSVMRQRGELAAVIRYVPDTIPALESLHVPMSLAKLALEKRGLVLMVGATGSGKSTTLAAMIDHRNTHVSGHILTFEDPIEFNFTHKKSIINQREIGIDTPSFATGLRNALRQSPDLIYIGEIRDIETMTSAMSYAQSGHLCLATLHANNSAQALHRILGFFPPQGREVLLGDLSSSLKAIVAQRLIKTINGTLKPAVEIMINTTAIAERIAVGDIAGVQEALEKSLHENAQSFEDDLARLVLSGTVTQEEALKHADSPTNLLWRLENPQSLNTNQETPQADDDDDEPIFTEINLES